jgi:hypothetical protein
MLLRLQPASALSYSKNVNTGGIFVCGVPTGVQNESLASLPTNRRKRIKKRRESAFYSISISVSLARIHPCRVHHVRESKRDKTPGTQALCDYHGFIGHSMFVI